MPSETSLANLRAGDLSDGLTSRDRKGKFDTPRAEMGRARALEILENQDYQDSLLARMVCGEAGPIEVWVWRIGYGDPPKPKEDTSDDEARFDRLREKLKAFMKQNPEEARTLGGLMARAKLPAGELPAVVIEAERADPEAER